MAWVGAGLLLLVAGGGCASFQGLAAQVAYNETIDETVLGWRNRVWANQAWQARKHKFSHHPHLHDFARGFRDGYREAASGGPGCPPPLPPRRYWSWRYNSLEGHAQTQAWFEGFPHGVQAAEEDGVVFYGQIPLSHAAEIQQQQHHPHAPLFNSPLLSPPHNPDLQTFPPAEVLPPEVLREMPVYPPLPGEGLPGQESGVRGQESGVRGQESGVRNEQPMLKNPRNPSLLPSDPWPLTPDMPFPAQREEDSPKRELSEPPPLGVRLRGPSAVSYRLSEETPLDRFPQANNQPPIADSRQPTADSPDVQLANHVEPLRSQPAPSLPREALPAEPISTYPAHQVAHWGGPPPQAAFSPPADSRLSLGEGGAPFVEPKANIETPLETPSLEEPMSDEAGFEEPFAEEPLSEEAAAQPFRPWSPAVNAVENLSRKLRGRWTVFSENSLFAR